MEKARNPEGSALKRFAAGVASSFDPRGLIQAVSSPVEANEESMIPTADRAFRSVVRGIGSAQGQQFQKSKEAWDQGRYSEAFGHGLAGALPVIGPGAAAIGEQIGGGDVAGGLGAATASIVPGGALAGARALKIPAGLKRSATAQYGQALRATKETMKRRSARVVPKLIERGATGSRAKLLKTAEAKAGKALEELKEAEASIPAGTKVKIEPVIDWLGKKEGVVDRCAHQGRDSRQRSRGQILGAVAGTDYRPR